MNMRWSFVVVMSLLLSGSCPLAGKNIQTQVPQPALEILGTVIGYDAEDQSQLFKPEDIQSQFLLVRIDKVISGNESAKYIWVDYEIFPGDPPHFPDEMSKTSKQWRFSLSRRAGSDCSIKATYTKDFDHSGKRLPSKPRMRLLPGVEQGQLPEENVIIKSYWLAPGGLRQPPVK